MSNTKPWLKLWTEIRTDIEMRCVDPAWRWAFVGVLCLAQELDADGVLSVNGRPMTDAQIADAIGVDLRMWREARAYFSDAGSFGTDPSGALCVVNFAKRQASPDSTNSARQARFRQSKATAEEAAPAEPESETGGEQPLRNAEVTEKEPLRNALYNALRNADVTRYITPPVTPTEEQRTENREQSLLRPTESTPHMGNAAAASGGPDGQQSSGNGKGSDSVDPSLFLSVIGFKNPESFEKSVDSTLLAQWAFYYHTLTDAQRRAVRNWPALINDAVRGNKPPRLTGEQKARFYREWSN